MSEASQVKLPLRCTPALQPVARLWTRLRPYHLYPETIHRYVGTDLRSPVLCLITPMEHEAYDWWLGAHQSARSALRSFKADLANSMDLSEAMYDGIVQILVSWAERESAQQHAKVPIAPSPTR